MVDWWWVEMVGCELSSNRRQGVDLVWCSTRQAIAPSQLALMSCNIGGGNE